MWFGYDRVSLYHLAFDRVVLLDRETVGCYLAISICKAPTSLPLHRQMRLCSHFLRRDVIELRCGHQSCSRALVTDAQWYRHVYRSTGPACWDRKAGCLPHDVESPSTNQQHAFSATTLASSNSRAVYEYPNLYVCGVVISRAAGVRATFRCSQHLLLSPS
jgi:hypothetical protein